MVSFLRTICFAAAVAALLGCEAQAPEDMTDPGQLLYFGFARKEVNCSRCHGPEGQGGSDAPDIRKAFEKFGRDKIVTFILDGKGLGPNAMPPNREYLTDQDVKDLLNYLHSLQTTSSDASN